MQAARECDVFISRSRKIDRGLKIASAKRFGATWTRTKTTHWPARPLRNPSVCLLPLGGTWPFPSMARGCWVSVLPIGLLRLLVSIRMQGHSHCLWLNQRRGRNLTSVSKPLLIPVMMLYNHSQKVHARSVDSATVDSCHSIIHSCPHPPYPSNMIPSSTSLPSIVCDKVPR